VTGSETRQNKTVRGDKTMEIQKINILFKYIFVLVATTFYSNISICDAFYSKQNGNGKRLATLKQRTILSL